MKTAAHDCLASTTLFAFLLIGCGSEMDRPTPASALASAQSRAATTDGDGDVPGFDACASLEEAACGAASGCIAAFDPASNRCDAAGLKVYDRAAQRWLEAADGDAGRACFGELAACVARASN